MSADLLAEFGDFGSTSNADDAVPKSTTTTAEDSSFLLDLGFSTNPVTLRTPIRDVQNVGRDAWPDSITEKKPAELSTQLVKEHITQISPPSGSPSPWRASFPIKERRTEISRPSPEIWRREADGSSVLFDASTEDPSEEDDFGDFETATDSMSPENPSRPRSENLKLPRVEAMTPHSRDLPLRTNNLPQDTADSLEFFADEPSKHPSSKLKEQDVVAASDFSSTNNPNSVISSNMKPVERKSHTTLDLFDAGDGDSTFGEWSTTENYTKHLPSFDKGTPVEARVTQPARNVDYTAVGQPEEDPWKEEPVRMNGLKDNKPAPLKGSQDSIEDEWGDFMDAAAGTLENDKRPYHSIIPTISSSPPPAFDLPTRVVNPNSDSVFGFVPFERQAALPSLANVDLPSSYVSNVTSDEQESPGSDWEASSAPKPVDPLQSKPSSPPALLRPSVGNTKRPSSFSTVASSDGDRSPGWDWKASGRGIPDPVEHVRPSNIPPPSVLLQLFPPIFERFQERIFTETVSRSSDKVKDSSLLELGRQVAALSRVVGRILAGRKHRWRRDHFLSQGMKIGQAQTGKGGGMKLAGIDRSETAKENRDVGDVLQTWKKYAGLFKSAVSSAEGHVVELSENMPISTASRAQGGMKANHACALCGLMRNERVAKVDANIEDSFGEFWTEHWGHLECRLFWEENQITLRTR